MAGGACPRPCRWCEVARPLACSLQAGSGAPRAKLNGLIVGDEQGVGMWANKFHMKRVDPENEASLALQLAEGTTGVAAMQGGAMMPL